MISIFVSVICVTLSHGQIGGYCARGGSCSTTREVILAPSFEIDRLELGLRLSH
jgi:hypothetical protein